MRKRRIFAAAAALPLALVGMGIAHADNIKSEIDSTAGNTATITAGGSVTVNYWVQEVSGCDASTATPLTVDFPLITGVSASTTSLVFTACGSASSNAQPVTFSSSTPNTAGYEIQPTASSGAGVSSSKFFLKVNAVVVTAPDGDGDGVADSADNCPAVANTGQANVDGDTLGDACDDNSFAPVAATLTSLSVSGNEGDTLSNSGSFTDADGAASLTITSSDGRVTDNGDGTWGWSHTPADQASDTVTVTATDGEHTDATQSFSWSAANALPIVGSVSLGGNTGTACTTGNGVTLDFGFTDAGVSDGPWGVDIDWGDGGSHATYDAASQGTQVQQSHSYGVGTYTVGITVTDKDSGVGTGGSSAGAVSHRYNMSAIQSPFNADGTSIWKYGSTIPVKVKVTDCHGASVADLAPRIGTQLLASANPSDGISETVSTSGADSTGVMRYDASAGQYIYNFASKGLTDGSAKYMMYVRDAGVMGKADSGEDAAGQSYQKFGLRLK